MNNQNILETIIQYFPKNQGVMLTGSQLDNEEFITTSDIDIMVFEPLYSNIHGKPIITIDGFKLDVVIIPISNLDELLDNESFDPKGGLLSMIIKGKILSDPINILNLVIKKSINLYKNKGGKTNSEVHQKITELSKFKKHFNSKLSDFQSIFLTSDFISHISTLETIRLSKWAPTRKHKADFLIKNNLNFTKQIYNIYINAIYNSDSDELIQFANDYCKTYSDGFSDETLSESFTFIDIYIEKINPYIFFKTILPPIAHTIKPEFLYAYFSLNKYHRKYKNNVTLCFNVSNRESLFNIFHKLSKVIKGELHLAYNFEIFSEKKCTLQFIDDFKRILGQTVTKQFKNNQKLNKLHFINLFCFLCSLINKTLDISIEDSVKVHELTAQKWAFSRNEQETHKIEQLMSLLHDKSVFAHKFYNDNKQIFNTIINYGVATLENADYFNTPFDLEELLIFICNSRLAEISLLKEDAILPILLDNFNLRNSQISYQYSILIDVLLQIIPLAEAEKWMVNLIMKFSYEIQQAIPIIPTEQS